jgi:hypothetical protein
MPPISFRVTNNKVGRITTRATMRRDTVDLGGVVAASSDVYYFIFIDPKKNNAVSNPSKRRTPSQFPDHLQFNAILIQQQARTVLPCHDQSHV